MSKNIWQQHGNAALTVSETRVAPHRFGVLSCAALVVMAAGCTTYIERPRAEYPQPPPPTVQPAPPPPAVVYVEPPPVEADASIRISAEADFYEPLSPYGRWELVPPYGRCWIPARVAAEWRPYCNGHWQRTERGWYWASDEPWAWATYHYGRWDWRPEFGWYWVPQTQWAPAWVSWHRSDRYLGWAPLHPSARFAPGGFVEVNERVIAPRAYVFVEERRFLEPVRPTTVVVNNTTIINKTVNITNIKVVNKTVINEGPRTEQIERDSGHKIQTIPAQDLRRRSEAPVVARHPASSPGRSVPQPPNRPQPETPATKPILANEPPVTTPAARAPAPLGPPRERESKPAPKTVQIPSEPELPREAVTTRPQESESKPVPKPVHVRSEPGRPKVAKEGVTTKTQESEPKPTPKVEQARPGSERPQVAKEAAATKGQTRAVDKRELQSEKKDQRASRLHPKHDLVAAEQGRTNLMNKAQRKMDDQPKRSEKD